MPALLAASEGGYPMPSIIVGVGKLSSQLTEKVVRELVGGPPGHGLRAIGVYDREAGARVRHKIHRLTRNRKLHVDDISVTPKPNVRFPDAELDDLVDLKQRIFDYAPESLLLIIDASMLQKPDYAEVFRTLRISSVQDLFITVVCIADSMQPGGNTTAYDVLEAYTQPDRVNNNKPIIEAALIVRTDSPLHQSVGSQDIQFKLVARSLAGICTAPNHRTYNPGLELQAETIRQLPARPFIGMALKTQGITMKKPEKFIGRLFYPIFRHTTRFISAAEAAENITRLSRSVLQDDPSAMTTVAPFAQQGIDPHQIPISINMIVPFSASSAKFDDVATLVQQRLTNDEPIPPQSGAQPQPVAASAGASSPVNPYTTINFAKLASATGGGSAPQTAPQTAPQVERAYRVIMHSIVKGRGVNLSSNKFIKTQSGKFYCQVCVLFALDKSHIPPTRTV